MATKVGSKGQIVIEKEIRRQLGVEPGSIAVQRKVGDHVEIRFYPPEHRKSLRGAAAGWTRRRVSPDEWPEVREQMWKEVTREKMKRSEPDG